MHIYVYIGTNFVNLINAETSNFLLSVFHLLNCTVKSIKMLYVATLVLTFYVCVYVVAIHSCNNA